MSAEIKRRVLVVEDKRDQQILIGRQIRSMVGLETVFANNNDEALDLLSMHGNTLLAGVLDFNLDSTNPHASDSSHLVQFKTRLANDVPFLLYTAEDEDRLPDNVRELIKVQVLQYFSKSNPFALIAHLKELFIGQIGQQSA